MLLLIRSTLVDPFPIALLHVILYIIAVLLGLMFICIIMRVKYKNTLGQWIFEHGAFGTAMKVCNQSTFYMVNILDNYEKYLSVTLLIPGHCVFKELDRPEEALRFEGYFTGTRRNWEVERAMEPDMDDIMRRNKQESARKSEQKLRDQDGLVWM